jgi:DNA repair ATPase RecN
MDLIDANNYVNSLKLNITPPSDILSKIIQMLEIIPNLLEDYEKNYVLYNSFPNNDEYTRIYETSKTNLEKMNSQLFLLNNNIEKSTEELTSYLLNYNKKITELKEENGKTKKKLNSIENKYNGSKELIENYKEMYNNQYFKNFLLFIGIFLSGTILTHVFTNRKKPSFFP